jgi:hypothetical protein
VKRFLFLALAFAGATAAAGWWTVPVVAAVWVRVSPRARSPARSCMAGAIIGWALLLGWVALRGPAGAVAGRVGGALGLPPWAFVLVTLLFPALLAGAAAQAAKPGVLR